MNNNRIGQYQGRIAVITGAADGIGLALLEKLLSCNMHVAALDVNQARLSEIQESLMTESLSTYLCDVSDSMQLTDTHQRIRQDLGSVSMLWINAGVGIGGSILDARLRNLQWLYDVNVWGAINTAREFVPAIIKGTGERHVGFIASSACLRQIEGLSTAYAASKYAFWGIAESIRSDLEDTDIGVSILFPSLTNTNIWNSARVRPKAYGGPHSANPDSGIYWQGGMSAGKVALKAVESISSDSTYVVVPTDETRSDFEKFTVSLRRGFE